MNRHYTINTKGTDYVVGDIHGHFTLLQNTLKELGFSEEKDRLFSVGDLVDRGEESHLALEWLDKPWFYPVRLTCEDSTGRRYTFDEIIDIQMKRELSNE